MTIVTRCMKFGAWAAAFVAVFLGIFMFSPIPAKLGFYRWLASRNPSMIGYTPAFHYGIPWNYTFQELYTANLSGQTAIVTGANSGIGYELSLALARLGANVTLACRNPIKCDKAASKIRNDSDFKGHVTTMTVDTSSLTSVREFAETYRNVNEGKALDMLFLNAGIGFVPNSDMNCFPLSEDGIEMVFQTNYVGHHLLYRLLEPMLHKSDVARVVQTSSNAAFWPYETYTVATDRETLNGCSEAAIGGMVNRAYGQSKLAQILWAKELTKRLGDSSSIYANAFHPGVVDTGIWDKARELFNGQQFMIKLMEWFRSNVMWTAAEGALTGLFLGVAVDRLVQGNIRGKYFHPQTQQVTIALAENETLQNNLWEFTDGLVKDFL